MNEKLVKELKEKLEKTKENLEGELGKFADKDSGTKGDWDTRFPKFGSQTGHDSLETSADEVEEYGNLLSIEHTLENRLKDVNLALDKMKKGRYGLCENCGKAIPIERLKVYPEAKFCLDCEKK